MMRLNDLSPMKGSIKKRKRVGRGPASGHGKTACRGHKGQKSRSGARIRPGFEGGQMPMQRRLPKRGFRNIFKKEYELINIRDLNIFDPGTNLDTSVLKDAGIIKGTKDGVKLLGLGEISRPLDIRVDRASKKAIEKVEAAGGKVELRGP
jgi:large subunit ribosomal protein L15